MLSSGSLALWEGFKNRFMVFLSRMAMKYVLLEMKVSEICRRLIQQVINFLMR